MRLKLFDNYGDSQTMWEWRIATAVNNRIHDYGLAKFGDFVWYSSKYNKLTQQFEVIMTDKPKHGTQLYQVFVKYQNNTGKLIIDSLHLKSNLHRVCVYVNHNLKT